MIRMIYARKPNLIIAMSETFDILTILRNTERTIDPGLIQVEEIDAALNADKGIYDDTLHIDALGMIEIAGWLYAEKPERTVNLFGNAFLRLFKQGTRDLMDTLKAAIRAVVPELEENAVGESSYFIGLIRSQHPAEFAELRKAWPNR